MKFYVIKITYQGLRASGLMTYPFSLMVNPC